MSSRRTILLVEDEELVRNYLTHELTQAGWAVTVVATGTEALLRLDTTVFGAVLCDLDLRRGPSGLDVLSRMPSKNEKTPFVILTAHGSTGRCRDAFLLGAADFLEKPISRGLLLATLDHAIADAADESNSTASQDDFVDLLYDESGAKHVRGAIQIMERRHPECDLRIADIAIEEGVTSEYLARQFRARLGQSPMEHLHRIRIGRAEFLLVQSALSIKEIGYLCGYARTSKFSSWFRRLRGVMPSGRRRSRTR